MEFRHFPFAALLLATSTTWAEAKDIPRYEPPAYCTKVAEFSGGSVMIYKGCLQMEKEAYNALKAIWSRIPMQTQNYCDEVARFSDRSYAILKGCVDMEADAAATVPEFKY